MGRKHIPLRVKLEVALLQLGLDPKHVRLDHHPPLELRPFEWVLGHKVYTPGENNPRYMQWLSTEAHALKTTGRRGTSKLSKRGGDISAIAKAKRIAEDQEEFRKRLLWQSQNLITPEVPILLFEAEPMKPRRRWPSRKIPARKR